MLGTAKATLVRFRWDMLGYGLLKALYFAFVSDTIPQSTPMGVGPIVGWLAAAAFAASPLILNRRFTLSLITWLLPFASIALIGGTFVALIPSLPAEATLFGTALTLCGVSSSWILWSVKLSAMANASIFAYVILGSIVGSLLMLVLHQFCAEQLLTLCLLLAIVSTGALWKDFHHGEWHHAPYKNSFFDKALCVSSLPNSNRSLAGIAIFLVALPCASTSSTESLRYASLPLDLVDIICNLAAVVLIGALFFAKRNIDFYPVYRFSMPVMLLMLLALPLLPHQLLFAGVILSSTCAHVIMVFLFIILICLAHDSSERQLIYICVGIICMNIGRMLAMLIVPILLSRGGLVAVNLFLVGLLIIVVFLALPGTGPRLPNATAHSETDSFDTLCEKIAAEHRLTPREAEVMRYLAQGYSEPVIAEKLVISKGTVHSHARNVFRKLNVNSKQKIIQMTRRDHEAT